MTSAAHKLRELPGGGRYFFTCVSSQNLVDIPVVILTAGQVTADGTVVAKERAQLCCYSFIALRNGWSEKYSESKEGDTRTLSVLASAVF